MRGACLCGQAVFGVDGPLRPVVICHGTHCRRLSGHCSASFDADEATFAHSARSALTEYETPGGARRGFRGGCGSDLWCSAGNDVRSVEAGVVNGRTAGGLAVQIFVANKGDYHAVTDGLRQADCR